MQRDPSRLVLAAAAAGLGAGGVAALAGQDTVATTLWAAVTVLGIAMATVLVASAVRQRRLGVDLIALVALVGALAVGESFAGAVITVMLASGRVLEARASARAERDLSALVGRTPRTVQVVVGGGLEERDVDEVRPGDLLLVRPGEVLAVDGRVERHHVVVDESALTGESRPVERGPGDDLRSGITNAGGPFELRATTTAAGSTYAAIVRMVEQASATSAPFVRLADRYALAFLVLSLSLAGAAWLVSGDPVRAVAVLVVATPCPLILAAPVAIVSGLARAARFGVVVKGGGALERLAGARVLLFDKTGTVTLGQPRVLGVEVPPGGDPDEALRLAASLDQVSPHVLAGAIVRAARERGLGLPLPHDAEEVAGYGIRGVVDGHEVAVGRLAWVAEGIDDTWARRARHRAERDGRQTVAVRVGGAVAAVVLLEDPVRPDAARTLRALRRDGLERLVMVSGDRDDVARTVATVVGVDEVLAERTPAEKVDAVLVERQFGPTVMVGDGLNDAAALAAADVGVALGSRGSSATSEAADVVVLVDRIDRLGDARRVAVRSHRIARQSVLVGMGLSLAAMAVAAAGLLPPAAGALLQEAIDTAVILNALRALRPGRGHHVVITADGLALTRRFQAEHAVLRPQVDRLLVVADRLGDVAPDQAARMVEEVHRFLADDLVPHEQAEDAELYPALAKVLGGTDPTGTMSRAHAEIAHLTRRLGRLLDDLDAGRLEGEDVADARRLLYGLHAVLCLHFAQEDEGYLSLADVGPVAAHPADGS